MKKMARWILLVLLCGTGLIVVSMKFFSEDKLVEVRVASPIYEDLSASLTSNGKVIPISDFAVRAAFAGTVQKIHVKVGDRVRQGQLLVQMNDPFAPSRYASATAALQGAQLGDENIRHGGSQEDRMIMNSDLQRAQLDQADAEKQLAMLRQLAKTGAASEGEIAAAEHRLAFSNTGLQALRDRLTRRYSKTEVSSSQARVADAQASLDTARAVLANANIASGIAGTIYSIPVTENDFVPMGAELLRVADLSKVQVRAYIDEPEMGRLAIDEPVTVTWEAKPDRAWHGHVSQIPLTVAGMGARMVGDCMVSIDDADGTLLPNTDVAVDIATARTTHALTIPRAAIHSDGPDRVVFRVIAGKLVRTPVQVGIISPFRAQITGGLSERDVVAISATTIQDLSDGLRVTLAR